MKCKQNVFMMLRGFRVLIWWEGLGWELGVCCPNLGRYVRTLAVCSLVGVCLFLVVGAYRDCPLVGSLLLTIGSDVCARCASRVVCGVLQSVVGRGSECGAGGRGVFLWHVCVWVCLKC